MKKWQCYVLLSIQLGSFILFYYLIYSKIILDYFFTISYFVQLKTRNKVFCLLIIISVVNLFFLLGMTKTFRKLTQIKEKEKASIN